MATKTENKIKVILPRMRPDESDLFVSVNNETFMIKRGVEVEIPDYVYAEIKRAEEQRMANLDQIAALQNGKAAAQ